MIWLTKEAWNHGCKHARYMRHPQALSFMAAALDLMDLCEDFEGCEDIKKDKEVQTLPPFKFALRCVSLVRSG